MAVRLARVSAVVATCALPLVLGTCTEGSTGPERHAGLALQLALPPATQLSAFNLSIDNINVIVVRPPADTVLNKNYPFGPQINSLTVNADVPLQQSPESFDVTIQMLSGSALLFSSTQSVDLSEGSNTVPPSPPTYVGPGKTVTSLSIAPQDTTLTEGGSFAFRPTALDAQDNPVSSYYLAWSTSDPSVTISPTGVLTAPPKRATVTVTARTWDGVTATAPVSFLPALSAITVVSGCAQSGTPGSQLPQPIVVRVDGTDALGVPGVTVQFTAPTGASAATPQVVTDANGLAQTLVTLASSAGPNQFAINATGLTTVTCTETGVGAATQLAFTTQPANVAVGGTITPPVVVYAEDAQNQFVTTFTGNITLALGTNPSGATLSGTTTVAAVGGAATFSDLSLDKVGTGYTLVATTSGLTNATSTAFNVTTVGGTHLVYTTAPSTVNAGAAITPAVVVTAEDAQSHVVTSFTASVTLAFGSSPAGSTLSGTTTKAAVAGVATFSDLSVDKAGSATLVASSPSLQNVASPSFTINAAAPASVVKISGDNQTGSGGAALGQPLIVEVRDAFANPVPSATVNWATTSGGSFAPASGPTGLNGRAQSTWTLGPTAPSQTATATTGALTPASFSATANIGSPAISLSFAGIPGVGVGLTSRVYVDLNQVAPVGGTPVAVQSNAPSLFTVAPTSVTIAQGKTRDSVTVTGVSPGQDSLLATASGFTHGALLVVVQNRNISVPATLNVPYGQTASLPIQLPAAAPAGGVTFTVVSNAGGFVSVATPSVTIPAGGTTANATLNGVLPGPATITVSNPAYIDGVTSATTSASLDIVQTSASLNASFGTSITINFESNNVATPAPAPGISVTLTPTDPTCLAVTSPVTIATGLVNTSANLTYGGSATLPCTTKLLAQATNLLSDSINVTVNPLPGITVNAATVASGLQIGASGNLGASNHGGVTVSLMSGNPNVLLSTSASTVGSDSIGVFVPNGSTSFSYTVQALEGQTGTTPVTVTAKATGFANGIGTISLVQGAIDLIGVPASTTTLSPPTAIYARTGIPNSQVTPAFLTQLESVRAGAPSSLTVTFTSQTPTAADLVKAGPSAGSSQTALIPALSSNSPTDTTTGGVLLRPQTSGSTTVAASITGFLSVTNAQGSTVNITQPGITVNAVTVGSGLQVGASGNLGASNHGGTLVSLLSGNVNVLLSTSASTAGSDSIAVFVPNNSTTFSYTVQALEGQTGTTPVTVTAHATGFANGTGTVSLVQGAIDLIGVPSSTTTLSPTNAIYVRTGIPNSQTTPAFLTQLEVVRAGAPGSLTATFTSQTPATGDLVKAGPTPGATQTAVIPVLGDNTPTDTTTGGVLFRPLATGSTTVSASIPGYLSVTSAVGSTVNVTQPGITVNAATVGSGLQVAASGNLGASNHGGVTVSVISGNPNLLVSTSASTVGSDSIGIFVPNNSTSFSYTVQALEGQTGTTPVTVTAKAANFANGTGTISLVQGAIDVIGVPASTTTLSPTNNIYARVGIPNSQTTPGFLTQLEAVRAGAPSALTVTFTSVPASIGDLVKAGPLAGASQTATIPVLGFNTPTDTTTGGVLFRPLLSGNTTISAAVTGFLAVTSAAGSVVIVTQPSITVNAVTVGSGLQVASSGSLGASNHGGKLVSIISSNPAVLVSPNTTTPGTDSIAVFVPNNSTSFSYVVQGLEGQSDTVTAAITAKASGFTDGSGTAAVVPPAFDVIGLPATPTAGSADVAFYVRVGVANSSYQFLTQLQAVRAGAPAALTVSITSNAPSLGTLVVTAGAGATQQVTIPLLATNSPTSVATGGVAFRPVAAGPVTITTAIPGYIGTTSAVTSITVQ